METNLWRRLGICVCLAFFFIGTIILFFKRDNSPNSNREDLSKGQTNGVDIKTIRDREDSFRSSKFSDPLLSKATFRYLQPFLQAIPQTVTQTEPPNFLTDVKNPCFAMAENYINVGNIDLDTAIKMGFEVNCLPYVYLAGR